MSSTIPNIIRQAEEIAARKAAKIGQLQLLIEDPDCADFVLELISNIRNFHPHPDLNPSNVLMPPVEARIEEPQEKDWATANIMRAPVGKNGNGIQSAIRHLGNLPARFTARDVLNELMSRRFRFVAEPTNAVKDALYALKRRGEIHQVIQGSGGKPSTYEWRNRKGNDLLI